MLKFLEVVRIDTHDGEVFWGIRSKTYKFFAYRYITYTQAYRVACKLEVGWSRLIEDVNFSWERPCSDAREGVDVA